MATDPQVHRVLPVEEAATHTEPERGPWQWSGPVQAIVSDSGKWARLEYPQNFRIGESSVENLYACGYAVVEVACPDCPHPLHDHRWGFGEGARCTDCDCVTSPRPTSARGRSTPDGD